MGAAATSLSISSRPLRNVASCEITTLVFTTNKVSTQNRRVEGGGKNLLQHALHAPSL